MDNKFTNIKERILYLTEYHGDVKEKFFDRIGMTYGSFKGKAKLTPINSDALANILSIYSTINSDWLITGKGEMLKKIYQNEKPATTINEPKEDYNLGEIEALKRLALTQEKTIKLLEDVIDQNKRSEITANDPARSLQK